MFCTVKSRTGGSELLDAPETLKFFGVDQIKNNLMLDINVIMNRISQNLFSFEHFWCIICDDITFFTMF